MIRRAEKKDILRIGELLSEVNLIHHKGRPDIFNVGRKYTPAELEALLCDGTRPILVWTDERDEVMGYCFCMLISHEGDTMLTNIKTLYIDDLCVDGNMRGRHIGRELYEAAVELARAEGCYNLTLNVWSLNESAMRFYESCGLKPQKICMEHILED